MGDFGGTLKSARERKGVSLRSIANATKISMSALESLERNEFSRLPGGIFSRSFVRAYAEEVGLDPDETVADFLKETGETFQPPAHIADEHAPVMPAHPDPGLDMQPSLAPRLVKIAFIAIPLVAAIVYFAMKEAATVPAAPPSTVTAEQASAAAPQPAPAAPETPAPAAASGPIPDLAPGQTMRIVLTPSANCWVEFTVDGAVRVSREMLAGEREMHEIREGALLRVGNAAAMAFTINGRASKSLGAAGSVETLRITRANFKDFLQ